MRIPTRPALLTALILLATGCLTGQVDHSQGSEPTGRALPGHFDTTRFASLFDGRSLDGWTTAGGRYDGKAVWTVEEGAITGREGPNRAGGLIYTERDYRNFIVCCDCFISYPFDSGVFVRMVPKPGGKGGQITLDYRERGEIGGVYADGYLAHNEAAKAKWRRDQWNRVEVRCTGADYHLECWLNGEKITDYQMPAGSKGYAPRGKIGLQVHGARGDRSVVRFKNIALLELPEFDPENFAVDADGRLTPTQVGRERGWQPLFESAADWRLVGADQSGARVRNGVLEFPHVGGGGYLRTAANDFRDFELRLDFKLARGANSGLFLRAGDRANPAFSGCEIQILDDHHWEEDSGSKLKDWQFSGSLYGSVAPRVKGALNPNGTWNTYQVRYVGSKLRVVLNGHELYDIDTLEVPVEVDGAKPFAERVRQGFLGLQRHAPSGAGKEDDVFAAFRNLYVRRIEGEK